MYPVIINRAFDAIRFKIGFTLSRFKWRLLGLHMGRKVEIYRNVVIQHTGRVSIGDHSTIGSFSVLLGTGGIKIGRDVLISSNCSVFSITHRVDAFEQGLLFRDTIVKAAVEIGDNVWIGTGVRILPGVTIGANTVVGAGSVVTKSLPSGVVAVGVPARVLRRLDAAPVAP